MPNEQLLTYVRSELARGVDVATLTQSLLATGWNVENINAVMNGLSPAQSDQTPRPPVVPVAQVRQEYNAQLYATSSGSITSLVQNTAAGLFIFCTTVLTGISVLGVWDFFSGDVISKSFETIGLLAFVAIVVIAASHYVGDTTKAAIPVAPNPIFRTIRTITVASLIGSAILLAFLGVMSIWNVINNSDILGRSMSSLAIIALSSFIIILICLEREQTPPKKK